MNKLITHKRLSQFLNVLAYNSSDKLFFLNDQYLAFGFIAEPLSGAEQSTADRLNVLLNSDWPKDTIVQFCLIANPNINRKLINFKSIRCSQKDRLLRAAISARSEFLKQGAIAQLDKHSQLKVREFNLLITCKIPIEKLLPSDKAMQKASQLQKAMNQTLKTIGFEHKALNESDYLAYLSDLINVDRPIQDHPNLAEEDKPLNEQVTDYDTALTVSYDGLQLGTKTIKTLSFKRLPSRVYFGHAAHYAGDKMTGSRGIFGRFYLTATLQFPDSEAQIATLETKRQWAINQAYGPMLKFVPILAQKKHGFDVLFEAITAGDRPLKLMLNLVLISDSSSQAISDVSNARTYYKELGFELMEDKFFSLPIWLNSLPFVADKNAIKDLFRYKTLATQHASALLPIFSDWKGTGTPAFNLISRTGQLMDMSLYDSGSNFNCCIAAQSGSGKSFLVNEMIASYLALGGQCWVIDVGRSYEKLCELFGGTFLQFGKSSQVGLNPFAIVQEYEEEADILVGLVSAMAAPTEKLTDFQSAHLKREMHRLWLKKGREMKVDDIADVLKTHEDIRIRDVGQQLYPFTESGEYGRFFMGTEHLKFDSRFTVLELEELKGRKNLQQVVLLQLIYQIQQEMYLGIRDRHKILFIDEAWDLLTNGDVGKFIETGYRRFRKYGGSAVTVTQSVNDLYNSPTGKAIVENSANMYLLGQKTETVNQLKKEGRLPLNDAGYELLKTVHTVSGLYSEIFFLTERGAGIGRLMVDPFHKLLYSSKAEDVMAIKMLTDTGMSTENAILTLLKHTK
ncbi:type IV secretion system protein TraC [Thorsellia anophelis]|uniref:Conjugal transfer ATP-binding protein TraC n=1 Tax=Thorsellia anophelis DSM 18579 TaxID=1123402 RepID=A0A1I0CZU0_9GAMM|nr:type IV secretion system protein TraC [Thorsellia anophelis]SET25319.1 conjugal transfer ATP-binding protein TraC [Thorsellia anophelis DSM 18579]